MPNYVQKQAQLDELKLSVTFDKSVSISSLGDVIYHAVSRKEPTYYQPSMKMQCHGSAARSIDDMYRIAKSYLQDINFEQVYKAVQSLYLCGVSHYWCYDIRKQVHLFSSANKQHQLKLEQLNFHLDATHLNNRNLINSINYKKQIYETMETN